MKMEFICSYILLIECSKQVLLVLLDIKFCRAICLEKRVNMQSLVTTVILSVLDPPLPKHKFSIKKDLSSSRKILGLNLLQSITDVQTCL